LKYHNYEGERKKYDRYEGQEMLDMVRATLERELPFYRKHNIPVILMPIDPFYYQLSHVEKNPTLKKWKTLQYIVRAARDLIFAFNELLVEVSDKHDLVFFMDTRPIIDAQNRDETHADHIHYSAKGDKLVAEALLEFMVRHNLIPQSGS
jgi:lysophospholipase L1-like esterase